jgi:hypothetical protein
MKKKEQSTLNFIMGALVFSSCLFVGLLVCLELGRRWGGRQLRLDPEGARIGTGAVEGAVFALLGLLIAFTFSGAADRFDRRRIQIVDEANAIGTAWLRLDLLPAASQPAVRELFRQYVDSRLAAYQKLSGSGLAAAQRELEHSVVLQNEIWRASVAGAGSSPTVAATTVLLPALNEMFDIVTTRAASAYMHPPPAIYALLFVLCLAGALFAGAAMAGGRTRNALHVIGFAAIMSASVYLIVDLEFPRYGLIRIDAADQLLVDVRKSMD